MKKRMLIGLVMAAVLVSAWSLGASASLMQPYGEITSPEDGELVFGLTDFEAVYFDDDPGGVQWAVRYGTCAAATNTVFGNVDGYNDPYSWDGSSFHATADTSTWTPGHYCFVLNPREEADEQDVRLTRWFWVVDQYVGGGGQLIEEMVGSKRQDWFVISFGGGVGPAGASGYVGEWEVNFHNVGVDAFDKTSFHTTSIDVMNFYRYSCGIAMNFTATGVWSGNPGYKMIFRAQDAGEPGSNDNARIEIWAPGGGTRVYDTHWSGEFTDESNCVGTARTGLDHGNLQMEGW
jgi:hypothetical protein